MIWIIAILMILFIPWPMTLLGAIGFLVGGGAGFAAGLVAGLIWSMGLEE